MKSIDRLVAEHVIIERGLNVLEQAVARLESGQPIPDGFPTFLEGQMTFLLGEDRFVAEAGTFLNMPVGSLHCFKNESDKTARLLISVAPAGLEQMFFEVGQPLDDDSDVAPPPTHADIEKLLEAAPRYGVEIKVPHE